MDSKAIYKMMLKKCPNTKRNKHYLKRYIKFISACIEYNRYIHEDTYTERHHILPKSIWPEFKSFSKYSWNKAILTARQHYIAHVLLAKSLEEKMHIALYMMMYTEKYFINSIDYADYKIKHSKMMSDMRKQYFSKKENRDKLSEALTASWDEERKYYYRNVVWTEDRRSELSLKYSNSGNPMYNKTHSKESREKISNSMIGEKHYLYGKQIPEKTKEKMRNKAILREQNKSEEEKELISNKIRKKYANRPIVCCPHCGVKGTQGGAMSRWHFDNCKNFELQHQ